MLLQIPESIDLDTHAGWLNGRAIIYMGRKYTLKLFLNTYNNAKNMYLDLDPENLLKI